MARLLLAGVAAGVVAISSFGCSDGGRSPIAADAGPFATNAPASTATNTPDSLAMPYELHVDLASMQTSVTPLPDRAAAAQGFVFDLDIANFMRPANLRVASVERLLGGDLVVRLRHSHPFPAVAPTSPAVGLNRADLGYTGRLLVLADAQNDSYFSGAVTVDPGFLANADGYAEVGNLLATSGLTNNAFPYKLLVDEALDNREGITNGGLMTGSYNPGTGGWQRGNLGPQNTGWTGYDYLHGGQACEIDLRLASSRLTGTMSIPLAVLIKYVDPKGVGTGSKRIPPSTPDVTFFSYRLPHSAMDVSKIDGVNTPLINDTAGSSATLQFQVRDWDSQAATAADSDLSDESNVAFVLPGTTGFPTVELSMPAFAGAPILIFPSGGATGVPGDEIPYLANVTNSLGTAPAGNAYGLIRCVDKEDNVPAATAIHFGVDPVSLAADAARALRVRTYQTVRFIVQGTGVPPEILSVTPPGGTLGRVGDLINFSAIASNSPTGWNWDFGGGTTPNTSGVGTPVVTLANRGSYLGSVDATNAFGTSPVFPFSYDILPYGWARTWGAGGTDVVTALDVDSAGDPIVAGVFSGTVDFDPGTGTTNRTASGTGDVFVAKYNANGDFQWVATYGGNADATVTRLAIDSTDRVYVIGTADADFDSDPGAGTSNLTFTSDGVYAILLGNTGSFVRSYGWDNVGVTGSTTVTGTVSPNDDLMIGGHFINALGFDMDPTFGTDSKVTLGGVFSFGWTCKINSTGTYQWGRHWGNLFGHTRVRGIICDGANNARIVGSWTDTTDFDPGAGVVNRTAVAPLDDAYMLSLSTLGAYFDVRTWGNSNEDQAQSIARTDGMTCFVGGWTRGAAALDIDPGATSMLVTLSDTTLGGVYLSRFSLAAVTPAFNLPAQRTWDSMGNIRMDGYPASNNLLVGLRVATNADADPGAGSQAVAGTDDPLFVVTDGNGDYINHYFFNEGGSGLPVVSFGPSGECFAGGYYQGGPIDFDPNPAWIDNHTSNGSNDGYLVRLTDSLLWD